MVAVTVLIASAGAGVSAWLWVRHGGPSHPEISAYSHGQLTRVGPFMYCNVLNLNECQNPQTQGTLTVDERDPIQLSVPSVIGSAPWRLVQVYENPIDTTTTLFRPDARLAVTIPTADPQRGRLHGFAVQLMTLVQDERGELREVPHAEWSVKTVWN
jgi:hypothetical protein